MNAPVREIPPMLRCGLLTTPGVAHAFFTREGGVSRGFYGSLNGGVGSNDDPAAVAENKRRMAVAIGVSATHFLVPYQIHSPDVLEVREPWADRKSTRLNSSHIPLSRMPSSA